MIKDTNPDHYRVDGADFKAQEYSNVVIDALVLLKAQEAIKPQLSISGMWYECPICHRHIIKDRDNYCARCRRLVQWK